MTTRNDDHLRLRLDPPLKEAVELAALDRGVSVSHFVREALASSVVRSLVGATP